LSGLPCPIPYCEGDIIGIKKKAIENKKEEMITETHISDRKNKQRLQEYNQFPVEKTAIKQDNTTLKQSTYLRPKPTSRMKFCICGVLDPTMDFCDDYICEQNHDLHLDCIFGQLSAQLDQKMDRRYIQIIMCPYRSEKTSDHPLNISYVEMILHLYDRKDIINRLMAVNLDEENAFECLNLLCQYKFLIEKNSKIVSCPNCCASYCMLCKKFAHGGTSCEGLNRAEFLNLGFMPCPFCSELFAKDDKCNHVKCSNCKNDFCFRCSAKRSPILEHGNHYHRPFCPDYIDWNGDEPAKQKCVSCSAFFKKTGKWELCPRPLQLVSMDIPEDETAFNKEYLGID
jgi:hypothetical protein